MGRGLSGWLVLARLVQILGSFVPGAMNGWLLYYISSNKLSPSILMLVLEILVAASFLYALLSLFIIHTRQRSRRTACMVCSVACDVVICFVDITILSILSFTGLPLNCSGLTASTWTSGDRSNLPSHGYTTIRFSNEQDGHRGELDKFCGMERGFFFCTTLVIFTYILTIILSVYRVFDVNYTRNSEIQHYVDEREEMLKLELKLQEQEVLASSPPSPEVPRGSMPPVGGVVPAGPASLHRHPSQVEAEAAEAAMFANSLSRSRGTSLPSNLNQAATMPGPSLLSTARGPTGSTVASSSAISPMSSSAVPVIEEEASESEMDANLAMVVDGSRYGGGSGRLVNHHQHAPLSLQVDHTQLPPYSPGNQRTMSGHGDESNEIRLSEYVKGETRAQDMKDEGHFG